MTTQSVFLTAHPLLFIQGFWLTWWFNLLVIVCAVIGAVIYHKVKIKAAKNEKAEMERRMLEKSELLVYSKGNEQKAREEANMANHSKSIMLTKITHEIRTPMNAMMGMASLLNETCLNPEQRGFTASLLQSGDGLLTLINDILMQDILEFSKIDSGKELEFKEFDLRNSIEDVLDIFGSKAVAAGAELTYCIDDDVPPYLVGDAYRLRQILMNLVENAFRFTNSGEVFVGVSLQSSATENMLNVAFEVKDTGKGMTPEKLRMVSEDLLPSDTAETVHESIGLTLIICKKLVSLMGGSIKVESSEGKGTTFRFNISVQASLQPRRTHLLTEMAGFEGKKVLVVDDNDLILKMIKSQLAKCQLVTYTASSAAQAIELLKSNTDIELVITDLQMPDMDGIELGKWIRHINPSMPVIVLNTAGDESLKLYPHLFNFQISKPVKQHVLIKHISSALRQKINASAAVKQKQKKKLSVDFAKQHPLQILVGEDDAMNQQMVKMVLSRLGYEIKICRNGQEVLEEVSQHKYDLILMDVQMPVMDGLEATRMIRLCLSEQPVIIAMTANTLQGDREMCLTAGMDDYIGKPVKLEELVDLLEKWSLQAKQYTNLE